MEFVSVPAVFDLAKNIDKIETGHEAIIAAGLSNNDRLGRNFLVFSDIRDNESIVALGVGQ